MPVTILELAKHRGAKEDAQGQMSGEDFARVGLQLLGGCERCGASIAAYNAYPSQTGFWRCEDCIGDLGFSTVYAANAVVFREEQKPAAGDSDHDTLLRIQELLDGVEWGSQTLEDVAEIMSSAGYKIRDLDDSEPTPEEIEAASSGEPQIEERPDPNPPDQCETPKHLYRVSVHCLDDGNEELTDIVEFESVIDLRHDTGKNVFHLLNAKALDILRESEEASPE